MNKVLNGHQLCCWSKGGGGGSLIHRRRKASRHITPEAVYEIAKIKHQDEMRWNFPLEGVARRVLGSCRSMGAQVREAQDDVEVESTKD